MSRPTTVAEFEAMVQAASVGLPPGASLVIHPDDWYTPDRPGYWERALRSAIARRSIRRRITSLVHRYRRGPIERFRWCTCGDELTSWSDRMVGQCWVCRSLPR